MKNVKLEFRPSPNYTYKCLPSPTTSTSQKPPKVRIYQKDELTLFEKQDKIKDFNDINANHAPAN